jgi:hypothetical protein
MRRSRVRRIVVGVLRTAGRYAIHGLIGMQSTWIVVMPEVDEASADRCGGAVPSPDEPPVIRQFHPGRRRPRRLSAAERRAWADLERRLR